MTEGSTRSDLERRVIERASRDPQFRKDFAANPRETVEREFGVTIPENIEITVVEETPSTVYVVLPPAPAQSGGELTDQSLEEVAGGGNPRAGWTVLEDTCTVEDPLCRYVT